MIGMTAYVDDSEIPRPRCPKCGGMMPRVQEIKPEHSTVTVACSCDGILYTYPRPMLILTPVRR